MSEHSTYKNLTLIRGIKVLFSGLINIIRTKVLSLRPAKWDAWSTFVFFQLRSSSNVLLVDVDFNLVS